MKNRLYWLLALAAMLMGTVSPSSAQMTSGQSVADAARANQQTRPGDTAHNKVYTNDDFAGSSAPAKGDSPADVVISGKTAPAGEPKVVAQLQSLREQVLQDKQQVAKLQQHLDRLEKVESAQASLSMTGPLTPQVCASEPERCEGKRQAAADLTRTRQQLATAQQKLQDLQERLRKQGYGSYIWDP